jgi:two-component system, NtrC family, nitrogen regulation sensor histidine kinase NtrY
MANPATFRRRRISLQIKAALGLLVMVLAPLLASAYLIDQIGKVAANFAANEAEGRDQQLIQAADAYRAYFNTTHQLHAEIARRLAARDEIARLSPDAPLDDILRQEQDLVGIAVVDADGGVVAERSRPVATAGGTWRVTHDEHPLPGGAVLRLGWQVRDDLREELKALGEIRAQQREIQKTRTALPIGYQRAFLFLVGGAALVAVVLGVLASLWVTHRIGVLVHAARAVEAGQAGARAALSGRDEMAELAVAFNAMLDGLDQQRRQIEYLQRIGAWQDVARKLAHEIKNPLTPIQLAVQQCVSAYPGGDARFARLLADTGEIVEEEIAALRRLVDTFRTLGQLPRVEAHPVPLRDVIAELRLDPQLAERLTISEPAPPDDALTVRADKLLLKRVLANLAENGVHAGQEAGRAGDVTIGWQVARDRRSVAIHVDDQGRGIADDERERIFEPYVTTKPTGTGLGLAIAKKIALEHGGALEVAPRPAPIGGARFVITLPLGGGSRPGGDAARSPPRGEPV